MENTLLLREERRGERREERGERREERGERREERGERKMGGHMSKPQKKY